MKLWQIILTALVFNCSLAFGQSQRDLYNASVKAYESKDYKTFLKLTQKLDSLHPFHPTYTYNLASAYALNTDSEKALATLKKMVMMDNTAVFETDEDFRSFQETDGFRAVLELKKSQSKTAATSKQVLSLSEKDLHPEGLIYLPKSKKWLASSIHKRKIVSFDIKTGKCTDWLKDNKLLAVFAMKADQNEQYLWVATSALPEMENFSKDDDGRGEVLKVDIRTQQVVKRYTIDGNHVYGDLILAKDGIVYVSDSGKPMLYKIENDVMAEFVSFASDGFNLQGLAFNKEQSKLFIADYLKGIAVIDMKSKAKTWLTFPEGTTAKGIDGLLFYNNSLIAIQNGVKPIRVTQFRLNDGQDKISSFRIIDNNRAEFNEPAPAALVGGKAYFFANCPWNAYDKNGVLDLSKIGNPMLFSCELN